MLKVFIQPEIVLPLSFLALSQREEGWNRGSSIIPIPKQWNKKRSPVVYRVRGRIGF